MQKRSLATQTQILEAALECFARHGYEATSVAEICKTAGVSKGAFYHHFPSKQAIFIRLLEDWLDQIDQALAGISQLSEDTEQMIQHMVSLMEQVYGQAAGKLPMFLEFWTQASHDTVIWQALVEPYQRYQAYFRILFKKGVDRGIFKDIDPDSTSRAFVSLALGLLLQGLLDPHGANWAQVTQESIKIFMEGISS